MFKLPSLIKINKNKQFEYRPRYYSQLKERKEQLMNENKVLSKEDLKERWNHNRNSIDIKSQKSNIRLIYIVAILIILTYFILKANISLVESILK